VPLAVGDVIRNLNGKQMTSLEMLRSNLRALAPGAACHSADPARRKIDVRLVHLGLILSLQL
jgi:hypothetical protein